MKSLLRVLSLVCTLAWAGLIYYLSDQPTVDMPSLFAYQDKLMHLAAFAVLGFLSLGAMRVSAAGFRAGQVWLSIMLVSLFGVLIEYNQSFLPGRDASIGDLVADLAGASLGAGLLYWLSRHIVARTRDATAK